MSASWLKAENRRVATFRPVQNLNCGGAWRGISFEMRDPGIRIVRARERSLGEINRLIARSKSYWNWPPAYLEAALVLHVLTTDYLQTNHCFEVLATDGALIGFCCVVADSPRVILDNLWVTPELIGRGVGRRTCEHLFRLAQSGK